MAVISVLQCLLYLTVIPACLGIAFTKHFDEKYNTLGNILTIGFFCETAVFEILFLVFYKFGRNLTELTWVSSFVFAILCIVSIVFCRKTFKTIKKPKFDLSFFVFVLFTLYMIFMRNYQGVNDGDDAFVLGNALTTLTTGRFYKIDYYTGRIISSESFTRHFLASNSIFIAYLAKVTFIHPTILAHRILGSFVLILHYSIIYNISGILFNGKKDKYRGLFASFVSLMTIWDFHSYLCDSTFILSRTWQGKAMFCALAIPFAIYLLLMIGECEGKKKTLFALGFVLSVASVSMTPASIYLLTMLLTIGSLCETFVLKKFSIVLKNLVSVSPMAVFALLQIFFIGKGI